MMSSGVIGDRQLNSPYNASSSLMSILILDLMDKVNPVRNSSGALNPAGIILKSNPAAASGPEGLWPGGSSGTLFLTG